MLHEAAHAHRDKLGVNESSFDRMMERPRAYTDHIEKHAVPHMHPDWQGKYHAAKGKAPQYQAPMRKAIFLLLKSHIAGYTRSDGVYVKPHDDKRTKKTQQLPKFKIKRADLDGVMGDMFAGQHGDEGTYTMPKKEAIKEHERLVNVLNSPSHEDDKREAKEQTKELAEIKGEDKSTPMKAKIKSVSNKPLDESLIADDNKVSTEINKINSMKPAGNDQYADKSTYENDPKLASIAKKVAASAWMESDEYKSKMSMGEFKQAVLRGEYPGIVRDAVEKHESMYRDAINTDMPEGYKISVDGAALVIVGPDKFDDDLNARVKKAGGRWDGDNESWRFPIEKGQDVAKMLSTWIKTRNKPKKEKVGATAKVEALAIGRYGMIEAHEFNGQYRLRLPYNEELKAKINALPGAKWDGNVWTVDVSEKANQLLRNEKSSPTKQPEKPKYIVRADEFKPIDKKESARRVGADDPSIYGSHLLGHEGEMFDPKTGRLIAPAHI